MTTPFRLYLYFMHTVRKEIIHHEEREVHEENT